MPSTSLELIFQLKPRLRKVANTLAEEGASAGRIVRALADEGGKVSRNTVVKWLNERIDQPPTEES